MRTWSNLNSTRQPRSGSDVRVSANHAIMLNNRSGIDDYVVSDHGIRVDDRASHDRWTSSDLRRLRNDRYRMNRRHDLKSETHDLLVKLASWLRVANRTDADKRVLNPALLQLRHHRIIAEHFHAQNVRAPLETRIQQADDLILPHRPQYLDHDLRVTARAEADNRDHQFTSRTSMNASA